MLLEAYQSSRIRHAQQDGNREFISLVTSICIDGTSLLLGLVYKGESHDLQSLWLDELGNDKAYFTIENVVCVVEQIVLN